ncbi:sensor histidine kinase [Aerophototrophica crusticola]|uniref:sensor histidine kinase n=1 Tax=Aerophototrophica crusticola TaxID=1709002 RepID=UPI003850DADD
MDGYPGALGQVVTNLVVNSTVHAYAPGRSGKLSLVVRRGEPGDVEITYADDGRGMSATHLPRVFEPFFTTRRGTGGTGLGLHIVYNIVTKTLGGRIEVASRLGHGTRFTLTLPLVAPVPTASGEG